MANILVVDDEESIRITLDYILSCEGHKVLTASNGKEALSKLNEFSPDLITLDIMMPGINGYEVCRRI